MAILPSMERYEEDNGVVTVFGTVHTTGETDVKLFSRDGKVVGFPGITINISNNGFTRVYNSDGNWVIEFNEMTGAQRFNR